MKKLWLIPLFVLGLSFNLQAQTISNFYGTTTTFVPNLYSDIQGFSMTWMSQNLGGTTTETLSQPFLVRGYDNKTFTLNYGGGAACNGTVTIYGMAGTSTFKSTLVTFSITATGTALIGISRDEMPTLLQLGKSGTGTLDVGGDFYTKKR